MNPGECVFVKGDNREGFVVQREPGDSENSVRVALNGDSGSVLFDKKKLTITR